MPAPVTVECQQDMLDQLYCAFPLHHMSVAPPDYRQRGIGFEEARPPSEGRADWIDAECPNLCVRRKTNEPRAAVRIVGS
jgi:hypothetical protein